MKILRIEMKKRPMENCGYNGIWEDGVLCIKENTDKKANLVFILMSQRTGVKELE